VKWATFQASRWYRVTQVAVLVVSFGPLLYALVANVSRLDFASLRFDLAAFGMAILFTGGAVWLGALAWGVTIQALYPELKLASAVRQHLISLATKYLPGPGWQQVSKAVQLWRNGVPMISSGSAAMLDLGMVTLMGVATSLQIAGLSQADVTGLGLGTSLRLIFIALSWLLLIFVPPVASRFLPVFMPRLVVGRRLIFQFWIAELLQVAGWLMFGIGFWYTCNVITYVPWQSMLTCAFALITSVVVGIIVVFVPNGIGVRELVMSSIVQIILPPPLSVIAAVMSRVVLISAELIGFLGAFFLRLPKVLTRAG
jgi:hypothetical protein